MKLFKLALISAFCCLAISALAQSVPNTARRSKIDSLYESVLSASAVNDSALEASARLILQESQSTDYTYGEIQAKILIGYLLSKRARFDSAKVVLDEVEKYFAENKRLQESINFGRVLLYRGMVGYESGEYASAKIYADRSRKVFSSMQDRTYEGEALRLAGAIDLSLDNYSGALTNFLEAYRIQLHGAAEPSDVVLNALSVANVYSKMAQYERAVHFASRAVFLVDSLSGDFSHKVNAINQLGAIYSNMGKLDSSLYYYSKARDLAISSGNTGFAFVAAFNIANVQSNAGEFALSNHLLTSLLEKDYVVFGGMKPSVDRLFARNYLMLKKYDKSLFYARKAAKGTTNKQHLILTTEILFQIHQAQRSFDSAFFYLKRHYALKDSVFSREHQKKFGKVFAELETIEKQFEIESLRSQAQLEALQRRNLQIVLGVGAFGALLVIAILIQLMRYRKRKSEFRAKELAFEIENRQRELRNQTLKMIQINNRLAEIEEMLVKVRQSPGANLPEVQQVLSAIHLNKAMEKEWENFSSYFNNVHEGFATALDQRFGGLSVAEKRLAILIKMNLTNKEIASILNIEYTSVKMAKYRLKRKLGLSDEQDINSFLSSLETFHSGSPAPSTADRVAGSSSSH